MVVPGLNFSELSDLSDEIEGSISDTYNMAREGGFTVVVDDNVYPVADVTFETRVECRTGSVSDDVFCGEQLPPRVT